MAKPSDLAAVAGRSVDPDRWQRVSDQVIAAFAGQFARVEPRRAAVGFVDGLLAVCDGQSNQGRDHPVAVVLALVPAATVAGLKGYTAISGWVADLPTEILDSLYTRVDARPGGRP